MYYTIESSNAWGATCFLAEDNKWTFKHSEAIKFKTLDEAQTAAKFGLGKLGRIERYKD